MLSSNYPAVYSKMDACMHDYHNIVHVHTSLCMHVVMGVTELCSQPNRCRVPMVAISVSMFSSITILARRYIYMYMYATLCAPT